MIVIRKEQMSRLRLAAQCAFVELMITHLAQFAPLIFKAIGKDRMREVVRLGIDRAQGYGLTFRGPVRLYLELMILFGSYFDTDPQYPWAAEILTNCEVGPQMQRAHWLYESAMDYRRKVAGPKDAYMIAALKKIEGLARYPLRISSTYFVQDMLHHIEYVYPEKAAYVGNDGFENLIRQGIARAKGLGFSAVREVTLLVVLMVAFGSGCDTDPIYPWIGNTFEDGSTTDHEVTSLRLEQKALTWLENALAYFDGGMRA